MRYEFTVLGNQSNPFGNPIPYFRTTQGSKWSTGARRYAAWKDFVAGEFERQVREFVRRKNSYTSKPIDLKGKVARMDIVIEWSSKTHADCDNVFKGIADALFVDDKNLAAGSFESRMATDKRGKVIISITINENE